MKTLFWVRTLVSASAWLAGWWCLAQMPVAWDRIQVEAMSSPELWQEHLNEHLIVVDAGHGGQDGGTTGSGVLEKNVALEIARRVEEKLKKDGFRVKMTRADDSYVSLEDRTTLANRAGAAAFVSIHLNAAPTSAETAGAETYFCSSRDLGILLRLKQRMNLTTDQAIQDKRSEMLANMVQRLICQKTTAADRGVRDSTYYVVRHTECPAILVECGYLTHEAEAKRLSIVGEQEKLASAIAEGVKSFVLTLKMNPQKGIVLQPLQSVPPVIPMMQHSENP